MKLEFQTGKLPADQSALHVYFAAPGEDLAALKWPALGDLAALVAEAERVGFKAKDGESVVISGVAGSRFALLGAGESAGYGQWRILGARAHALAAQYKLPAIAAANAFNSSQAQAFVEGVSLAAWDFSDYKKPAPEEAQALKLRLVSLEAAEGVDEAIAKAQQLSAAVNFARDLANEPPNVCTPTWLAQRSKEMAAELGLEATVFDHKQLIDKGMNLIDAVGRGSKEPPVLVHLVWRPEGTPKKKVALVGKGMTFDSGGYSLKPPASQLDMHLDMGGAVAVLGAAAAIGRLKPQDVEVHFIVPSAENLVSGEAYKVMDIIKAYNGMFVEVHNTDAEGRLVLADALSYAQEQGVEAIIDCATLTGACVVGLGMETAALFSDHDSLADALLGSAERSDEALWRLPLVKRLNKQLDSTVADIKNVSAARWGGAITAALFLQRFVEDVPWAHIDLAGPAMAGAAWEYIPKGGTGYGVLLLADWLLSGAEGI